MTIPSLQGQEHSQEGWHSPPEEQEQLSGGGCPPHPSSPHKGWLLPSPAMPEQSASALKAGTRAKITPQKEVMRI